jgi:potassium intermediate/small conductance calcium-activated channel subfamily N protein 2
MSNNKKYVFPSQQSSMDMTPQPQKNNQIAPQPTNKNNNPASQAQKPKGFEEESEENSEQEEEEEEEEEFEKQAQSKVPKNANAGAVANFTAHDKSVGYGQVGEKPQEPNFKKLNTLSGDRKAVTSIPKSLEGKSSGDTVRGLKADLKKSDTICAIVSSIGLFVAYIENFIYYNNENKENVLCYILRSMVSLTCLLLTFFVYLHYKLKLDILKARKVVYKDASLWSAGFFGRCCIEIFISWIHCPILIETTFTVVQLKKVFTWSVDDMMCFFMLLRLYLCLRLFDHYTVWTGERASRVCKMNGFQASPTFALKAYLKYRSFVILSIAIGVTVFLFGFAVNLFERSYFNPGKVHNFNTIWNAFWCVIVTMTTIGYGDIFPESHMGRFIIIVACIWGVFILSLFVVMLNNNIQLSKEESDAYEDMVKKIDIKENLQNDAILMMQNFFRLKIMKMKKCNVKDRFMHRMDFVGITKRFSVKRKRITSSSASNNDILQEIHETQDKEMDNLFIQLKPVFNINESMDEVEKMQVMIGRHTMTLHNLSQKLYNFVLQSNRGELGRITSIDDVRPEYNFEGIKMDPRQATIIKDRLTSTLLALPDDDLRSPTRSPGRSMTKLQTIVRSNKRMQTRLGMTSAKEEGNGFNGGVTSLANLPDDTLNDGAQQTPQIPTLNTQHDVSKPNKMHNSQPPQDANQYQAQPQNPNYPGNKPQYQNQNVYDNQNNQNPYENQQNRGQGGYPNNMPAYPSNSNINENSPKSKGLDPNYPNGPRYPAQDPKGYNQNNNPGYGQPRY